MLEVASGPERVLIVGVQTDQYQDQKFMELMKEMHALTETAQGQVIQKIVQKMSRLDHRTGVGSGKLQEIKAQVEVENIDLVIFFNALTPSMNRAIEDELGVRVIDRVQLILDIFAMRANSREGKLQVSLAQYEYLLPRIGGKGKSLSRLGGGIGTRGPGETKLESDRRHIRSRINQIKKELVEVVAHRERTRLRRQSGREFNIGLVGYTNAGKSTLLTELTHSETYVQDQLFATLDPLTRQLTIKGHPVFTLTDTVGFIEELPTELIQAFKSTLEEIRYMDLLLHVVDASNPARDMHEETVLRILEDMDLKYVPILTVYNKRDLANENFVPILKPNVVISAKDHEDLEVLKEAIWTECIQTADYYTVTVLPEESDLLALYQQKTMVVSMEYDEEGQYYRISGYRRSHHRKED
ncbi:GTPase HflX [Facklamia sp. DSM 111018]|uniref:GTPase HflX n=1 Tax=Facklamia lactis TaxID=2749967 RepID=A0ABS0LRJ1_9LACT|nr:GTPase HflX [Facklamia lactis]MBG9980985.1 GTPase HflX [Facklamia lactis]MBG9986652.1 GTPase HflX [Facklamia lactis]